jgi:type IV pilus assembly protein PilC
MFFFLVTNVIPEFAKFFRDSGKPIPPITQSLIDLGDFFGQYGVLILVLFVLLILSLMALYRTARGRLAMDTFTLRVPLIGGIVTFGSMSQLTWSLSMLLNSGLTAVEALDITGRLIPNRLISNNVFDARERVIRGQDLASSLVATGITPLVQQLAGVGEKSGNLDRIMEEAGNFYEEALQVKSKLLGAMIEPAAILIIGTMVGFVYYAFLKTIFSVG